MKKIAVLLTVFNRKATTLQGLKSLYKAIEILGEDYSFDIYMTDDGSTDGTAEAVAKEFSDICITKGNGNLFWSGGMRKAWQASIDSGIEYDFFLWFNDDAVLYENAFVILFRAYEKNGPYCIVTGAFCGHDGKASYGGKIDEGNVIEPNGAYQDVALMNGNFVLVPFSAYSKLGTIDKKFKHGFGDYDYGLRAHKNHIRVVLTAEYVGICDRHDVEIPNYFSTKYGLLKRLKLSYNPQNSPYYYFIYMFRYEGLLKAIKYFIWRNYYTIFPQLFKVVKADKS